MSTKTKTTDLDVVYHEFVYLKSCGSTDDGVGKADEEFRIWNLTNELIYLKRSKVEDNSETLHVLLPDKRYDTHMIQLFVEEFSATAEKSSYHIFDEFCEYVGTTSLIQHLDMQSIHELENALPEYNPEFRWIVPKDMALLVNQFKYPRPDFIYLTDRYFIGDLENPTKKALMM